MTADCIAAQEATATKTNRIAQICTVLLLLVLALGIFVRVYRLGSWPPLYGDEATPGVGAMRVLAHGASHAQSHRVYLSSLYVLTQVPFVALLGNTIITLRLSLLVYGLLTILAAYFTARRLWGPRAGLIAAAAAAILPLSVVMGGRIGWEPALAFPIVAWALYFSVLAWQQRSVVAAIVCGALLALGTYAHPAASLAVPGLIVGALATGKVRAHLRQGAVVLLVFVALSFPSITLMRQLAAGGSTNTRIFTHALPEMDEQRRIATFSPTAIGTGLFRSLDHCTGAVTAQHLLGSLQEPWSRPIKLLRAACVGLWLFILIAAFRKGTAGRAMVGYLAGLFAAAHVVNPGFILMPQYGRYLLSVAPVIPLLVTYTIRYDGALLTRLARPAIFIIFAMWAGVTVVMLSFIHRGITGTVWTMTTSVGDPNKAAAAYFTRHADAKSDLVLCSWWHYWPLAYYSSETLPVFTSDLVIFENEDVVLPETTSKRKVWWIGSGDAEPPKFAADLVSLWPASGAAGRCYTIWLAREPETAIKWAVDDYLERLAQRQERLRMDD
jgi:4-amino-4-deoxy-L-arabinose transferase-like glycosyltransferase